MTFQQESRRHQSQLLINVLNELQEATTSVDESATSEITDKFINLLKELPIELLPYAAVSQFVYNNESEDFLYFIEKLESILKERFPNGPKDANYFKGIKLIEHMELAQQQKDYLFEKHEKDIQRMDRFHKIFMRRTKNINDLAKEIQNMDSKTKELQDANKNTLTQFITILGIFAAILMGAFGSVQGFANIFENAHKLKLGEVLIFSSIGASSVLLILFFLLNGIAKLTGRSLSSTNDVNGTIIEKHPTLVITHGILIAVALVGASLELSNINLKIAKQGLWWMFPALWIIYFVIAINKNKFSIFTSDNNKKEENKEV